MFMLNKNKTHQANTTLF